MRFAVDVVFLSRQMRVLGLASRVQPWRIVLAPRGTGRVLELAAGQIAATGLQAGTFIVVESNGSQMRARADPLLAEVAAESRRSTLVNSTYCRHCVFDA